MTVQVPLSQGLFATVDDDDLALVSDRSWEAVVRKSGTCYAIHTRTTAAGIVSVAMHRVILGAQVDQVVDHRDGDGLNNRRENLRTCTALQNARNRAAYVRKKRAAGGFLGVTLHRQSGLWFASIHAGPPDKHGEARRVALRYHATPEAAARVFDSAARYYFGEFAALNFPHECSAPFDPDLYGYRLRGAANPSARLTEAAVRDIRQSEEILRVLAQRHGVSIQTVARVRRGLVWAHVA